MKNQLNACISEKIKTQNEYEASEMNGNEWKSGSKSILWPQVGAKRLEQRKEKHEQAHKGLEEHKKAYSEHQQTRRDKEQMSPGLSFSG